MDNAGRLQLALKARKHDDNVISTLRTELEQALQQANSSRAREAHALELVAQLRQEVKSLTKYAHQAFAEGRASASGSNSHQQHKSSETQPRTRESVDAGERQSQERVELMPDFATWKRQKNHLHDHSSLKAPVPSNLVPLRNTHLRSPMERAVQRNRTKIRK